MNNEKQISICLKQGANKKLYTQMKTNKYEYTWITGTNTEQNVQTMKTKKHEYACTSYIHKQ